MSSTTLDQLAPNETGKVTRLHSTGLARRRLMDLGMVPGTMVSVAMVSPLGDPVAYQVRGATIALRRSQAREIEVSTEVT